MQYWLAKTEPEEFSIDHLKRDKKTAWSGVRNYQARNFLAAMEPGDKVLIYHSSTDIIGVAGIGKVIGKMYVDPLQFSKKSDYFDPRPKRENPIWITRDIGFVKKFKRVVTLDEMRSEKALKSMRLIQPGNRLSVLPVTKTQFDTICRMI